MTARSLLPRIRALSKSDSTSELGLNRKMLALAVPSLVENILHTLLGFVDMIFVGQLGPAALAGVGLGIQWMFTLQVLFMGLSVGNTALVARAIGAGDARDAFRIAKQSLLLAATLSIGIALIGFFFANEIIRMMGADPNVTEIGSGFLRIVATFSISLGIMFIGGGTLRGAGDTRTPMLITLFINAINIALAYLLIFGNFGFPRLGTNGSALATTIARTIGAGLILYVLFKRGKFLRLNWRGEWGFHRDAIKRILNIGGPAAAEQIVMQFGFIGFSVIVLLLGTNDLAAQQIAFNIAGFSILPAFAFGVAALTLVGQNLGAQQPDHAQESAWHALKSGTLWMCVMGVGFFVWRGWLVSLYTQDPEVQRLGEMLMIFLAFAQPAQAISIVLGSALRGAGDTRATLVITFIGIWLIRDAVGFLMGIVFGLGLFGVWIGWIADFALRALLVYLRFRAGKWKTLRV